MIIVYYSLLFVVWITALWFLMEEKLVFSTRNVVVWWVAFFFILLWV